MTRKILIGLLCFALFFTIAAQDGKSYRAERFDVNVELQPDGSLVVTEDVVFNFSGDPFSFVFRELPTDHTDGVTIVQAGVDGERWPPGSGAGEVEINGRDPIEVVWHLPPTSNVARTFNLSYDMLGVVRRGEEADILDWQALPDEYEYDIDASRVTIHFPPGAQLIAEPELRAGDATITTGADHVTFDMRDLSAGDPLVARLSFAPGTFTAEPPQWQVRQQAQNSRAWIWFAAAAAVLVGGFAAFMRAARPYTWSAPKATSYIYKPPVDLPPALAGYLANQTIGWHTGLATLLDLAARSFVEIEQISEGSTFHSPQFVVTLLERPQDLRPHEEALVELLFTDKHGVDQDVVTLSEMGQLVTSSRWKQFTKTLEHEAEQEGLVNVAAKQRQTRLTIWSTMIMLLPVPLLALAYLLRDVFGMWTFVTLGAMFLLGLVGFIFAMSISPLSDKGRQFASAFEPFRRLLKDVARNKETLPDLTYYEAYLPYAMAYGHAQEWVKGQAKSDYQRVPAYFRAAGSSSGAEMAAFVVVISSASNSGGAASASGAGAAGAAAAGGGASGAG